MTELSWALYFIGVIGPLKDLFTVISVLMGIGVIAAGIVNYDSLQEVLDYKYSKKILFFWFTFVMLAVFLPSEGTLYRIAAVEVGDVVVQTQEAQEVKDLLLEAVKHKLEGIVNE